MPELQSYVWNVCMYVYIYGQPRIIDLETLQQHLKGSSWGGGLSIFLSIYIEAQSWTTQNVFFSWVSILPPANVPSDFRP